MDEDGLELDILADLMDEDDQFTEAELASLDADKKQTKTLNETESNQEQNVDENKSEDIAKKFSKMENYIKYLESQIKTQNINKSPESNKEAPASKKTTSNENRKRSDSSEKPVQQTKQQKSPSVLKEIETPRNTPRPSIRTDKMQPVPSSSPAQRVNMKTDNGRVAHTRKMSDTVVPSQKNSCTENKPGGIKRKAETSPSSQTSAPKKAAQDVEGVVDGFSGLKILNPLISSATMERRMEGRKMIKISSIQSKVRNNDIEGDWVTIGVLVQKLPPKTSVKGNLYSIWKFSDLNFHSENSTISIFLFGESHKEHWKTSEGSVLAFLNPTVMPAREEHSKDVALSIDNPKKLMLMGISMDFGRCQGARKSDGNKCSQLINKSYGNFCEYHVRREYNKSRSKRMECQQGYGAPRGQNKKSKLMQKIASENFMYQGQTVSSHPSPSQKQKVTLKSLAAGAGKSNHLTAWKEKQEAGATKSDTSSGNGGPSDDFLNLLKIPTVGARNLMRQLHKDDEKAEQETQVIVTAKEFLKANKVSLKSSVVSTSSSSRTTKEKQQDALSRTPVLGRGLSGSDDIFFEDNVLPSQKSVEMDKGKRKALALVRQSGPFTPQNPNNQRVKKPSPKLQNDLNDKLDSRGDRNHKKKTASSFSLADDFDLDSSEGQRLLKAKSCHIGEVKEAELKEEQKYFESGERKEAMEEKMKTITQLKVTVFHCPECKYIAEKASNLCGSEHHTLKKLSVFKKFFECKDCKERTVAYGQRYPAHLCRKCGAKNYQKCSMWKEKTGPKVGGETLMLRGPEYAKFLNSVESPKTNGVLPKYL